MSVRRLASTGAVVACCLAGLGGAAAAQAAPVACGQVITADTTLQADVGPCSGDGIIIGAPGITLDLGGHTVFGDAANNPGVGGGPGRGIVTQPALFPSLGHDQIRNGTVTGFATGVFGTGPANVVARLRLKNDFNGVNLRASDASLVSGDRITGSGGLAVSLGGGRDSVIERNYISANPGTGVGVDGGSLNFHTGPNTIRGNFIARNGGDGVVLFGPRVFGQSILANRILANAGAGVHIEPFVSHTLVQGNVIIANRGDGVLIDATRPPGVGGVLANTIRANTAFANRPFDLVDANIGCDGDIWSGNAFRTANQPCIH